MRKAMGIRPALALLVLAFLPLASVGALEFGLEGQCSNLQFPWAKTSATNSFATDAYIWGGSAFFGFPLGEDSAIRLTYERDAILRNVATMGVEFERGIAKISVGPFFGFLNADAAPFNAGLSTSIRFQWPGVAYASVRSDGAIALGLVAGVNSEPQARAELATGFYTRNAIVSAMISAAQFNETVGGLSVTDSLSKYLLTIELFKKNVPYTLTAETGYQLRSKCYAAGTEPEVLGSLILGLAAIVEPQAGTKVNLAIESAIFSYGSEALLGHSPPSEAFLFSARLGLSFDTEAMPKTTRTPRAKKAKASSQAEAQDLPVSGASAEPSSGEASGTTVTAP